MVLVAVNDGEPTEIINEPSLGPGASKSAEMNCYNKKVDMLLTLKATYDASATKGVSLKIYTSPDNTDWDDVELTAFDNGFAAGQSRQKSFLVRLIAGYVRFEVVNDDGTYAASNMALKVLKLTRA